MCFIIALSGKWTEFKLFAIPVFVILHLIRVAILETQVLDSSIRITSLGFGFSLKSWSLALDLDVRNLVFGLFLITFSGCVHTDYFLNLIQNIVMILASCPTQLHWTSCSLCLQSTRTPNEFPFLSTHAEKAQFHWLLLLNANPAVLRTIKRIYHYKLLLFLSLSVAQSQCCMHNVWSSFCVVL